MNRTYTAMMMTRHMCSMCLSRRVQMRGVTLFSD